MKNSNIRKISFTIKPDADVNLDPKQLVKQAKRALRKFDKDIKSGKLKPVDANDPKNFL